MKIKKVNELNENFEENILENNDKVQKLKSSLESVFDDLMGSIDGEYRAISFNDYWDKNGDELIEEFGILEKMKQSGNIRQILPQMVQVSNNSRRTQQIAQVIVDNFTSSELNDFKGWLQQVSYM